jgi:hypothetical protein
MPRQQFRGFFPAIAAAFAALLLCPALPAQRETVFHGDTSVVVVEVPVTVIAHGDAIPDLGPENFRILDEGRPQEIQGFEVLDADAVPKAPETTTPVPDGRRVERGRRNFLFLFDLAYSDARALAGAVQGVRELVTAKLQPGDRAGLAFFSGLRGFQWVLPLTDDRDDVAAGLAVLDALVRSDRRRVRGLLASWAPGDGARPATERARILDLMQGIFRSFRRTGWAVQSVNLNGLGFGRDSLLLLAKETGGQLFTNSNDVGQLVREVEARTRVVYMLTFQPDALAPDGSYHRLEVRLVDAPPGSRAVHRPGYYAPDGKLPPAPPTCPTRTCG